MICEIVCAQYKRGDSSLYFMFLLICQFIIECSDVEDFLAAVDFGLLRYFIRFLILFLVERLLIIHYRLNVSWHYYSFFVNSFNLTFYYCSLLTVKMIFRVGHWFECQLLEIFKVWHFFNAVYQKELLMTYLFKSFPEELIWYQGMLYIIMLILNYFEF